MGWAEQANPNSWWNRKRYPKVEIKPKVKLEIKKKTFWQWLKKLLSALLR